MSTNEASTENLPWRQCKATTSPKIVIATENDGAKSNPITYPYAPWNPAYALPGDEGYNPKFDKDLEARRNNKRIGGWNKANLKNQGRDK